MSLNPKRVEVQYAAAQGTYWAGNAIIRGFMALFLAYCGLSDAQIGYTSSLIFLCTIGTQLLLSAYADKHPQSPLKRTITALYLGSLAAAALLFALPLPLLMMIAVFSLSSCLNNSIDGLLNALMMQYIDNGVPARYGWPRGIGSIAYASISYVLGVLLEKYDASLLLPVFLGMCTAGVIALLLMPDPGPRRVTAHKAPDVSYVQMLRSNPTLVLLLCACILSSMGQCSSTTYLIRIVEQLGGTSADFGVAMFIQAGVELPIMFASSWLLRRFSSRGLLTVSFFCYFLRIQFMVMASSLGALYLVMGFSIFCFGIFGFSSVLFVNSIARDNEKVRAQSLISLCYTGGIGGILGNLFSGALIEVLGLNRLLLVSSGLCLAAGVVMLFCNRQYQKQFLSF